jgi:hypothetical protein
MRKSLRADVLLDTTFVMAGLVPAIHVFLLREKEEKTWMPGTSSAKTRFALLPGHDELRGCVRRDI